MAECGLVLSDDLQWAGVIQQPNFTWPAHAVQNMDNAGGISGGTAACWILRRAVLA